MLVYLRDHALASIFFILIFNVFMYIIFSFIHFSFLWVLNVSSENWTVIRVMDSIAYILLFICTLDKKKFDDE